MHDLINRSYRYLSQYLIQYFKKRKIYQSLIQIISNYTLLLYLILGSDPLNMQGNSKQSIYKVKTEQIRKNIRTQQKRQIFRQQRKYMGKVADKATIVSRNYQKLKEIIQRKNPNQIYQSLTSISMELSLALNSLAIEIFNILHSNLNNENALKSISIIIMHCFQELKNHLINIKFFDQLLIEIYKATQEKMDEKITLLIQCIKSMANRGEDIIDYNYFAQKHLFFLVEKLRINPQFMIFVSFTSQYVKLPLEKMFPIVLPNAINQKQNLMLQIASISVIGNITAKYNYQQLKPYISNLFPIFRQVFSRKNEFNQNIKYKSIARMIELFEMIPQKDYKQHPMEEQFQKTIQIVNSCKDIQKLELVENAYKLLWIVVEKIVQNQSYLSLFLLDDFIEVLIGGIPKHNEKINEIAMNAIFLIIKLSSPELPFVYKLKSSNITSILQKMALLKSNSMSNRAQNLLTFLAQYDKFEQQI